VGRIYLVNAFGGSDSEVRADGPLIQKILEGRQSSKGIAGALRDSLGYGLSLWNGAP
jgi:hypothetical protein